MMIEKLAASAFLLLAILLAAAIPAPAYDLPRPLIPVTRQFTLKNGMRVVLSEDHTSPVAALVIVYDVGARNEEKGRSGFAHLFEHMMFEGSENVGKSEHFKYVEAAGGNMNASTHPDFTNYFEKLPSNQIELALWLESDRLRSLKVTAENFRNQLETVKEEKRSRIDNKPYSPAYIKLHELVFDNWKNAHPTIGSFEDLESSGVEDVRQFFKTYYAPNNAVMAVVGDIDSAQLEPLIDKYFGTIPRQPDPPRPDVSEPERSKPRYARVEDRHATQPGFWIGWPAPHRRDPDFFALGLLDEILASGESSRLYQAMVKGAKVALRADLWLAERRGPGAIEGFFLYKPETTAETVRTILWREIDRLKSQPVSARELEKAKNQVLRGLFAAGSHASLQRSLGRAEMLAEYTLFYGSASAIDEDIQSYLNVTAADIQRVARKYLTADAVSVVDVVPARASAAVHDERPVN